MTRSVIRLTGASSHLQDRLWETDRALRIGRLPTLELHISDTSLSRTHAEVAPTEQGWVVRDLGSTNGTYLNGARLGPVEAKIAPGDHLQFGDVILTVTDIFEPSARVGTAGDDQYLAVLNGWDDLDRSDHDFTELAQIGRTHKPSDSIESYLNSVLWKAAELLDAAQGFLVVLDDQGEASRYRAELPDSNRLVTWDDLTRRASADRRSLLHTEQGGRTRLCALLRFQDKHLGFLRLARGGGQPPFTERDLHTADALALAASPSIWSFAKLQERQENACLRTLTFLTQLLQLRDDRVATHGQRVTGYALLLAEELGLSPVEKDYLRMAAPLHDLGKIGIKDSVLNKPGRLTPAEVAHVREQIGRGAELMEQLASVSPLLPILRNAHEHWDGSGYPDGLAGEGIPLLARVVAVADAFDAMTSDQPYRRGLGVQEALEEISGRAGSQFDPGCAAAFVRLRRRLEELLIERGAMTQTVSVRQLRESLSEVLRDRPARSRPLGARP